MCGFGSLVPSVRAALTGHVSEPVHRGEHRGLTALQEEDDQQRQGVVVEQGAGAAGISYTSTFKSVTVLLTVDQRINGINTV